MKVSMNKVVLLFILAAGLLLAGCTGVAFFQPGVEQPIPLIGESAESQPQLSESGGSVPSASQEEVVNIRATNAAQIVVDGSLVPNQSVDLAFNATGEISEVLVAEGDTVEAGQVLARLKPASSREAMEQAIADAQAQIAEAEKQLLSSQLAVDALHDSLSLDTAQAQLDLVNAQVAYDDSVDDLEKADANRADSDTIAATEAELVLAQARVDKAQASFDEVANKPEENKDRARRLIDLENANRQLDGVSALLNWYNSQISDTERAQLEADVVFNKATLDEAARRWNMLQSGPDPNAIALAEAEVKEAQAALAAAQAQLANAQSSLEDLDLRAPIAAKVVSLQMKAGEVALPGETVISLADFSVWFVETVDLGELDVVNVTIGQKASIVPESLPNVTMQGVVQSISDSFGKDEDDKVIYTARILLNEVDPRLRWGMSVVVTFEGP